jgi:hypothetical protein
MSRVINLVVADGVFAQLIEELGIERPDIPPIMRTLKMVWIKFLSDLERENEKAHRL